MSSIGKRAASELDSTDGEGRVEICPAVRYVLLRTMLAERCFTIAFVRDQFSSIRAINRMDHNCRWCRCSNGNIRGGIR